MSEISVILPQKSTAILPDADCAQAGTITGMGMKQLATFIERRLAQLKLAPDKAAKQAKKPDSIRNIYRAIESGRGGVSTKTLIALAPVLKVRSQTLIGLLDDTITLTEALANTPDAPITIEELMDYRDTLLSKAKNIDETINTLRRRP